MDKREVVVSNMDSIPHLIKKGNCHQLIVKGKPFIILGGELHNSSSSSMTYMDPIWAKLENLSCNAVIATVSWELVEPEEGYFDFSLVDGLITKAREYGMKLVLIWFGTWKNTLSTYVPKWVKTDLKRFPRAKLKNGQTSRTISCFSKSACEADGKAFRAFMEHLYEIDNVENTVLAVQVENEVGLLGSPRDYSGIAEDKFNSSVPEDLIHYLRENRDYLGDELAEAFNDIAIDGGTWLQVFNHLAEEVFMAYYTAYYVNEVAKEGKKEYPLPMLVNAWTVQYEGEQPGQYPSGGPVSKMLDIWKFVAKSIDIFAPDLYLENLFEKECMAYTRLANPLFIPETRRDKWAPAFCFYALGKHDAICFAPFGIDSIDQKLSFSDDMVVQDTLSNMETIDITAMLRRCYALLEGMVPVITKYNGTGRMSGVLQRDLNKQAIKLGRYILNIRFSQCLSEAVFPAGGILIAVTDTDYIIAGYGFSVNFLPEPSDLPNVDYLSIEEGIFIDGNWIAGRRLNGDELHVRLENEPAILKVSLFSYS